MFKNNKYQLMLYLIILVSIPAVSGVCFSGGTGSCQFTCHCRDDVACYAATGECPTGQCARIGESFYYTGNSCQIGNVAYGADATQTGSEDEHTADRAVDGGILAFLTDGSCAAAVREAGRGLYWQVDLGGQYVISYVQIYREINNRHTVSGVRVYVSDSNNAPSDATDLCGTQSGSSNRIECGSPKVGRYVRIEQPDDDIDYMCICETQVHGYRYHECGWYDGDYRYGPACVSRCHCSEQCDVVTGVCMGECKAGWRYSSDRVCSDLCEAGTWGEGCAQQCNCQGVCDRVNGLCTAGCTAGYRGNTCQEACVPDTWGPGCTNECNCQVTCNRADGECPSDCIPGYHGPTCSAVCDDGDWGVNCANQCSEYCVDPVCNKRNGSCSSNGCIGGYSGANCEICNDGKWGTICHHTCRCQNMSEVCDKVNGACATSGCDEVYLGTDSGCRPLVGFDTVEVYLDDVQQRLTIELSRVHAQEPIISFTVTYRLRYLTDQMWHTAVTTSLHDAMYDKNDNTYLKFIFEWAPQYHNTVYDLQVAPVYSFNDIIDIGILTPTFTYTQGCMPSRDVATSSSWSVPYTQLCSDWCTCRSSDGTSHWCLLTCEYCEMCDEQPLLPSPQDTHIHVQLITDTAITINITTDYNNTILTIAGYQVHYNEKSIELIENNRSLQHELSHLASGTYYKIEVYPFVIYKSNTFISLPFVVNATTEVQNSGSPGMTIIYIVIPVVLVVIIVVTISLLIYFKQKTVTQRSNDDDRAYYNENEVQTSRNASGAANLSAQQETRTADYYDLTAAKNEPESFESTGYEQLSTQAGKSQGDGSRDGGAYEQLKDRHLYQN